MLLRTWLTATLVALCLPGCDDSDSPSAGADGGSGGNGADAGAAQGSAGCGIAAEQALGEFVAHQVEAEGTTRDYFVQLPADYDPERPYPVLYQFHGCSGSEDKQNNNVPVQDHSGADAIHVRGRAIENCWDNSADGSGVAFWDALVPAVEASFCANPDKRFVSGYSSGSFMTHRLACSRGDQIRAVATIAGGQGGVHCNGRTAALLIHDSGDETVDIQASVSARDFHLERNGCDEGAATTPSEHEPCVSYAGCSDGFDVVWCETSGNAHGRQDGLAGPAFWDFFASF